jgi:GNAT superfamily N-acetyltransferase
MTQPVQIELLTGHRHLPPVLAAWHHAEWGHLYADDVWSHAIAVREFEAMAEPGSTDRTWVAFDGSSRDADAVLGSVSLLATDDLAGFEHVTPWLASMFVAPAARGRGVAAALTDALLDGARTAGHEVVHLFTAGQEQFWADRGWSTVATVDAEGHPATVMARSAHPRAARRAVSSRWCSDPDHGGAYSHLRLNGTPAHRQRLAERILPGLWFAGEATSVEHPATMHGAWFSGERAAGQVLADTTMRRVAVVGAGLAGIAAARRLRAAGREVTVLESKAVVGGRIVTDRSTGSALPLGGAWLHGNEGHPLRDLVTSVPDDWEHPAFFAPGTGRLGAAEVAEVGRAYELLHEAFAAAEPGASVASVLERALDALDLRPVVRDSVSTMIIGECESLYGAPIGDLAARSGFEDYELPGGDHLVTSDLGALGADLAADLDVRLEHRVGTLHRTADGWRIDDSFDVDAVIVTVSISALGAGRITFVPELPDDVQRSIASIGAGPITKVFAIFDEAWWPPERPLRLTGTQAFGIVMDVSLAAGQPTLVCFAVGDAARRVEQLSEHELCRLVDRELAQVGLTAWDGDPLR